MVALTCADEAIERETECLQLSPSRHLGAAQLLGCFRSEADTNPREGSQNQNYKYTPWR